MPFMWLGSKDALASSQGNWQDYGRALILQDQINSSLWYACAVLHCSNSDWVSVMSHLHRERGAAGARAARTQRAGGR